MSDHKMQTRSASPL